MGLWFAVIAASWGAEPPGSAPEFTTTESGSIRGTVTIASDPSAIVGLIHDPVKLGLALDGEAKVEATPGQEGCLRVTTHAPHPIMSVTYVARGCPTKDGFVTELIESKQLKSFHSVWTVTPVEGGAKVSYDLRVRPSFPLPSMIVRRTSRNGVRDSLTALKAHFE